MVSFLYPVSGRTQLMDDGLQGFCVTQDKNRHFPCGYSGYQSEIHCLQPDVSDRVCRRLQLLVSGFPNPSTYILCLRCLEVTS